MIYKINGKPYVNLDNHIDIEGLNKLKIKLCKAFADSWLGLKVGCQVLPAVAGAGLNWPEENPGEELSTALKRIAGDNTAPGHEQVHEYLATGKPSYALTFVKLVTEAQGIGYNMFIKQPTTKDYADKHLAKNNKEGPFYDNFKFFMDWVDEQNIFSEIGRTLIFYNDQDQQCITHRDHNPLNRVTDPDEFIWINMFMDRKAFFVEDKDSDTRHYIKSQVAWFDTANYHGSDTSPYSAFSIRVDGVFTDEFKKKINYKLKSKKSIFGNT
ncbi:hypothetical protein N9V27_01445 [bacterium]|jgi:hypothetical protein|nr:hypothetical protein [bacterium]|tara:strand:+ start:1853 stop:2659 length:807 start_codon:yes stop_codon:yes gene_type:complete